MWCDSREFLHATARGHTDLFMNGHRRLQLSPVRGTHSFTARSNVLPWGSMRLQPSSTVCLAIPRARLIAAVRSSHDITTIGMSDRRRAIPKNCQALLGVIGTKTRNLGNHKRLKVAFARAWPIVGWQWCYFVCDEVNGAEVCESFLAIWISRHTPCHRHKIRLKVHNIILPLSSIVHKFYVR